MTRAQPLHEDPGDGTGIDPGNGPGDAELIAAVRAGDVSAYGLLSARHVEAARRLARQLVPAADVDDLVADAFAQVLGVLQGGGGPDVAFRAFLLTVLRSAAVDGHRFASPLQPSDDVEATEPGVLFRDTTAAGVENAAASSAAVANSAAVNAARAFAALPEPWQMVLWHTEVEGQEPAEVAPLLGMSTSSVGALAHRAREGLQETLLAQHGADIETDTCRWARQNMGDYVRGATSRRDNSRMKAHLDGCAACTGVFLGLKQANSNLAAVIAPLLLGGAAAAYVAQCARGMARTARP